MWLWFAVRRYWIAKRTRVIEIFQFWWSQEQSWCPWLYSNRTRRFSTADTKAWHNSQPLASTIHAHDIFSPRSILMLISCLLSSLSSGYFPRRLPSKILLKFLVLSKRHVQPTVTFLISPPSSNRWAVQIVKFPVVFPITLSFLGPSIFLSILSWDTCNLCFFPQSKRHKMLIKCFGK